MKITARMLAMVLAALLLLGLVACGDDPVSDPAASTDSTTTTGSAGGSTESTGGESAPTDATDPTGSTDSTTAATGGSGKPSSSTTKKPTRATGIASDVDTTKYAGIGLKMEKFTVKNKTLRLYTGPEKTVSDYYSTTEVPGVWELLKAYYGINLELVSCGDYNDWYTKLATLSLSGDSPDVAVPASESYPYDIVKGNIRSLDEYFDFKAPLWDSVRDVLDQYTWNGKHYHAVFDDGQYMSPMFYNPKIFKQNGVATPREHLEDGTWTWETMLNMAVELTQDTNGDGTTDLWGTGGMFFTHMQAATGKSLVTIKGKKVTNNITDSTFATTAQLIYDMGPSGKYKVATAFSHDNADLFVAGKVAMDAGSHYRAWTTYKDMWKAGTVDMVPFPAMEKGGAYYKSGVPSSYVIYKNAKNVDAAKALIWTALYLQSDDVQDKLEAYGKKVGADMRYCSWLFTDIPGLTETQYNHIVQAIWDPENVHKMKNNPNNWIGWLDNGWDNGFQYAHTKQWSAIVNVYKNQFNSTIEEFVDTLDLMTE